MHNVETRNSKNFHKRSRLKVTKPPKSSLKILKKYKVLRANVNMTPLQVPEPIKIQAFDNSSISKTMQAFMEASNRKKQVWVPSTPVPKMISEEVDSEKEQSEENVYCDCKRPYCPGDLMFKCEGFCEGWYHPECLKMKPDEVERQKVSNERWYCPNCIYQAHKIIMDTSEKSLKKIKGPRSF